MTESMPDRVRVSGPLAAFADGFRGQLGEQGYKPYAAQFQLQLLAHLSRWMQAQGVDIGELSPVIVERFLIERRGQYASRISLKALRPLLGYLDGIGLLPVAEEPARAPIDELLDRFCGFLREERGLVAGSIALYERIARRFLVQRSEPLVDDLARLTGAEINAFVLGEARRVRPRTAETVVCALRALLRFLHVQGWLARPLASVVPSVPQRRENLPRGLPAGQAELLLASCDRATPAGSRDYAIVLMLSRLGLRAGEVAGVTLDDLDWRLGEIVIRGKRSRIDRLPLPAEVGEALAEYLSRGRPCGFGRTVFLRVQAPLGAMSGDAVSEVVIRACRRAGIPPVRAHRLRHYVDGWVMWPAASFSLLGLPRAPVLAT